MLRIPIEERPQWRQQAEALGFHFHTIEGERYWDERVYYAFTLEQIERDIEPATEAVHAMAMELAAEIVDSEALLERLAIPRPYWDWIRNSWRAHQPHLFGRMDLAYDGRSAPKLYELNYDTPTSLYEAGFFQWLWLEQQLAQGALPAGCDQFNSLQDRLVERLTKLAAGIPQPLYFSAVRESGEDQGTVAYLRDCAEQAGIVTRSIAIEDIGRSVDGRYTDLDDLVIPALMKLYPLEFMFEESFGPSLPGSGIQLLEPPWKALLSNKGLLPLLWERHRGHPNLLESRFVAADAVTSAVATGWVRKPFFSREGANIEMTLPDGRSLRSDGPYADGPAIEQAWHPLPEFEGNFPVIGSWVIGDEAAGMGIREDASPITRDTSRFIPHVILPG